MNRVRFFSSVAVLALASTACETPYSINNSPIAAVTGSQGPSGSTAGNGISNPAPPPGMPNFVCDPFSGGGNTTAKNGIKAKLTYYETLDPLPYDSQSTADFEPGKPGVVTAEADIFLSKLDVPLRAWDTGFSISDGSLLKKSNGEALVEWFSLRMASNFVAPSAADEGDYQFAVISDDGSLVMVDPIGNGNYETLVNNDGTHSQRTSCALKTIHLTKDQPLPFKIYYYQGPRYQIAMQLLWRKKSGPATGLDCSGSGFTVVPTGAFLLPKGTTNPCAH